MTLPRRLRDPLLWFGVLCLALLAVLILRDLDTVAASGSLSTAMVVGALLIVTALWWPAVRDQLSKPAALDAIALRGGLSAATILASAFVATLATGSDGPRSAAIVWSSVAGAAAVFAMTSWIAAHAAGTGPGLVASLVAAAYAALALVALEIVVQSAAPSLLGPTIGPDWPPASIIGGRGVALRATVERLLALLLAMPMLALLVGALSCVAARLGGLVPPPTPPRRALPGARFATPAAAHGRGHS